MTIFKKSLRLKKVKQEKQMRRHRIREWFSKWDRTIAAITALVVFCALLILVVVNITIDDDDYIGTSVTQSSVTTSMFSGNIVDQRYYLEPKIGGNCKVEGGTTLSCEELAIGNLCDYINNYVKNIGQYGIEKLKLKNINYNSSQIEEGWLDCLNLRITDLTLSGSGLTNIGTKAFYGTNLPLTILILDNVGITTFRKNMFEGLQLTRLGISCASRNRNFEANVLEATSQTLQSLQIANCITQNERKDVLTNITGADQDFGALTELDLRNNHLGIIRATNFQSATAVTSLYLSNSEIVTIEPRSFDYVNLNILDLRINHLKTLPNGIFNHFQNCQIYLSDNTFKCDCNLEWLKLRFESESALFPELVFYCDGDNGQSLPYWNVTFCSNDTTSEVPPTSVALSTTTSSVQTVSNEAPTDSTSTTVTPASSTSTFTETSTTPAPSPIRHINCTKSERAANISPEDILTDEVNIRNGTVKMQFFLIAQSSLMYVLRITGEVPKSSGTENMLWFNTENKDLIDCRKNITDGIELTLENLQENNTYIFCFLDPSNVDGTVAPTDCAALTVPLKSDIWISQKDMIAVICGICVSLILVSFITGIIVFYCIRQHPSFIKGNKRVIIVESKAADAIVMPPYYDEIDYNPPSLNSYSNGYLTPKHRCVYTPPRPSSRLRTISENTDFAVPSTSSGGRMKRSHYRKRTKLEHVTRAFDDHVYEPPPLPPNHPSGCHYNDSFNRSYSRV